MRVRWMTKRGGRFTVVSLTIVAAMAAAAALAMGAAAGAGAPAETIGTPIPPSPREPEPGALDSDQASLGVLRDQGSTSSVPTTLRSVIRGVSVGGENPDLGRHAVRTTFGRDLYVVPAAHGRVCLELDNGSAGCASVEQIRSGRFYMTLFCVKGLDNDSSYLLTGVLPDHARAATLHMADGESQSLTVENNVYALAVPNGRSATGITWSDDHGTHRGGMTDAVPPNVRCAG